MNKSLKFSQLANMIVFSTQEEFKTRNYLVALDKMMVTFIQLKKYEYFEKDEFKRDFEEMFNLKLTKLLVSNCLNRLLDKDYLKKRDKDYIVNREKIKTQNFEESYSAIANEMNEFVDKFLDYYNEEIQPNISREQADKIVCDYIENLNNNVSKIKHNSIFRSNDLGTFDLFLKKIKEENVKLFDVFKKVVIGRVFTAVILENDITQENSNLSFENLNIYLDSDFIFNALGLNYYSSSIEYVEMIEVLKKLNAKLYIFPHTLEEMKRVINNCHTWVNNVNFDQMKASKTAIYFVFNKATDDEINSWYYSLEERINGLGIEVDNNCNIDYNEKDLSGLYQQDIFDKITKEYKLSDVEISQKFDTYDADAKSIYAIHKLRKGNNASSLKNVKYIFVTHNSALCSVANQINEEKFHSETIPLVLNDRLLNVLLWFSTPHYSEITNVMFLVPSAYHAFEPSAEMVKNFYDVLNKMKDVDQITDSALFDWRTNPILQQNVMELTRNNPCKLDSTTPSFIIENYKKQSEKNLDVYSSSVKNYIQPKIDEFQLKNAKLFKHKRRFYNIWFPMILFIVSLGALVGLFFLTKFICETINPENKEWISLIISSAFSVIVGAIEPVILFCISSKKSKYKIYKILQEKVCSILLRKTNRKIKLNLEEIEKLTALLIVKK
ncbi:MAG: hypothetical protein MJ232_00230 [archaeon]|nr:hypothetical protein [Bacilli bacterium]MCQ2976429.1 hypothetical protein [archaeon]